MGESRSSREARERLAARDAAAEAERARLTAAAEAHTPIEDAVGKARLNDINYFNNPTPDYSTPPPGMIDATVFQRAGLNRLRDRMGTGGSQMGAYGANPTLLALNRENADAHTVEQGAGDYASNLAARRAEAYGGADATIGLNVNRALQLAGMSNQTAQNASTNYANYRPAPSMWGSLGLAALGGASAIGSAYLMRPRP
jgi:hypothetical protein